LGVKNLKTKAIVNYEVSNFKEFISDNGFELPEKIKKDYLLI